MSPVVTLAPVGRTLPRVGERTTSNWEQQLEEASRERVRLVRSQIASGTYLTEDKIDAAIERLMADL